ncbi:MAG: hypothetical protein QG608_213 [Actinomycetota bacterium]|nr:hypothetical protein [Actinomycetota bacterium]
MTTDPRAALDRLIAALEAHLNAVIQRTGETDPAVVNAYQRLSDAFEVYDEALYTNHDEVTPFVLYDEDEDSEDDLDEDLDEEDLDDLEDEDLEVEDEDDLDEEDLDDDLEAVEDDLGVEDDLEDEIGARAEVGAEIGDGAGSAAHSG